MEYGFEMELDPVQWQSTQAQVLGDVFRDAPVPPPPALPTEPIRQKHRKSHGIKRKRQPISHSTGSQDTLKLLERLEQGLEARIPARKSKNKRVSSAGAVLLGPPASASTSTSMPPPRLRILKSDTNSPLSITTPLSDVSSLNDDSAGSPLDSGSRGGSASTPGSSSSSALRPRTPPPRPASRPASVPTLVASSLISPESKEKDEEEEQEEIEPPPPPLPRPALATRTKTPTPVQDHTPVPAPSNPVPPAPSLAPVRINTSAFSVRSDSTESNKTATTVVDSPITPAASLPIIDLTTTPTPSPPSGSPVETGILEEALEARAGDTKAVEKASAGSNSSRQAPPVRPLPSATHSEPSPPKPKPPRQPQVRAQTIPAPNSRASPETSTRPPSECGSTSRQPSQTAASKLSQNQPKPASQYPRAFPSSQTRLGMGFLGKGYDAISKPFKVPNKGGASTPLTVTALPRRGVGPAVGKNPGSSGKTAPGGSGGKGAGKGKGKSPANAGSSSAGKLNFAPISKPSPVPPTGGGGGGSGRKTPTPVGRPSTANRGTTSNKKGRKEPSSDAESYLSDLDGDDFEAAMARWDN